MAGKEIYIASTLTGLSPLSPVSHFTVKMRDMAEPDWTKRTTIIGVFPVEDRDEAYACAARWRRALEAGPCVVPDCEYASHGWCPACEPVFRVEEPS